MRLSRARCALGVSLAIFLAVSKINAIKKTASLSLATNSLASVNLRLSAVPYALRAIFILPLRSRTRLRHAANVRARSLAKNFFSRARCALGVFLAIFLAVSKINAIKKTASFQRKLGKQA